MSDARDWPPLASLAAPPLWEAAEACEQATRPALKRNRQGHRFCAVTGAAARYAGRITRQELTCCSQPFHGSRVIAVSYTHLRAHETRHDLVCRLLLEKKK